MLGRDLSKLDDEAVMQRVARGDSRAFAVIVDRYAASVHHWAWQITQRESDADDICQEVYIRLWRSAPRFDPARGRLATWLRTMTRNLALNHVQRQRSPDSAVVDLDLHPDPGPDLDAQLQRAEQRQWLLRSVAALPARQREAMRLVYGQGLSQQQAAAQMHLGIKALEALLVRAKRRLRQDFLAQSASPSERIHHVP